MELKFKCAHCDRKLEADAAMAGDDLACPNCGFELTVPAARLDAGTTLGGYRIQRRLGKGAMGEVFLAYQPAMDRRVALKVLPSQAVTDSASTDRFFQEIRMAAMLQHPHIVTTYDAGQDHGYRYYAMSYIDGEHLGQMLSRLGAMPEKDALQIGAKIGSALAHAWYHGGVLHRDVKPSNIMVDLNHEPLLMDMGIAKSTLEDSALTATGVAIGTPHYMSPEQAKGSQGLDFRADMYSLGATLFHAISGNVPFSGNSAMEVVVKHLHDPLPPIRKLAPNTSQSCEELLTRMMAKDPSHRYPSWEACLDDIEAVIDGRVPKTAKVRAARQASQRLVVQRQVAGGGAVHGQRAAPSWNDTWIIVAMGVLLAVIFGILAVVAWHQHEKRQIPVSQGTSLRSLVSTNAWAPPDPTVGGASGGESRLSCQCALRRLWQPDSGRTPEWRINA